MKLGELISMSSHFGNDLQIPDLVTRCNQCRRISITSAIDFVIDQLHIFFLYKTA